MYHCRVLLAYDSPEAPGMGSCLLPHFLLSRTASAGQLAPICCLLLPPRIPGVTDLTYEPHSWQLYWNAAEHEWDGQMQQLQRKNWCQSVDVLYARGLIIARVSQYKGQAPQLRYTQQPIMVCLLLKLCW